MALDALKKRLYKKDEDLSDHSGDDQFTQTDTEVAKSWIDKEPVGDASKEDIIMPKKKRGSFFYFAGGAIAVLVVVVGVLTYLLFSEPGFDASKNLVLSVESPESVASGEAVTWKVSFENRNSTALESVDVIFEFPLGTLPAVGDVTRPIARERRSLGRIEPGARGEEEFRGVVFGENEEVLGGNAIVEFRPEGSSVRLATEKAYTLAITHSQITLDFNFPEEVQRNQEVEIRVKVRSTAEQVFEDIAVGITYPFTFTYTGAEPAPSEDDDIWFIGKLEPGEDKEIIIRGTVGDETNEAQTFGGKLGVYDSVRKAWTVFSLGRREMFVRAPFLSVSSRVENVANSVVEPGEIVDVTIFWKNNLPVSVPNAFVETRLIGDAIDLRGFQSINGSLNDTTRTVRWVSGSTPELSVVDPGEEGRLKFRVRIKDTLPLQNTDDRNFTVQFQTQMSAPDTPQGFEGVNITGESEVDLKIATVMDFKQQGFYFDGRIANFGPLPPKAGEETTYTIVWSLLNQTNEIREGEVRATLPAYVKWSGVVKPSNSTITFDKASGQVVWDVPLLPVGTGYTRPPLEVAFQLGVTPSITHVNTSPQIISEAVVTGRDIFADLNITKSSAAVTTAVRDDSRVTNIQQRVTE